MKPKKRNVILHYHLFKNAGTSVDLVLQSCFPGRWQTREFPASPSGSTDLALDWILSNPDSIAFSSHTMHGPLPTHPDLRIIPVILLRDPIKRIQSAYQFERHQNADTPGAHLAKRTDFEGYVMHRLSQPGDRQCRNFQTSRLASFCPRGQSELHRACAALTLLNAAGVVGLVERFEDTMSLLAKTISYFSDQKLARNVRANQGQKHKTILSDTLHAQLQKANADDLALVGKQHDVMVKRFADLPARPVEMSS